MASTLPEQISEVGTSNREACWQSFMQQRMRVWRPIYPPKFTIPFYLTCGLFWCGLGFVMLAIVAGVTEVKYDYTETLPRNATAAFELNIESTMEPPIWVYYELTDFFQNHRRYVKSFSGMQLQYAGDPSKAKQTSQEMNTRCNPAQVRQAGNRLLYPCGLVPMSVFNDSFVFLQQKEEGTWSRVGMDSEPATIAWPADAAKFRNLDPEAIDERTGLPNQAAMDMWILERFPPVECEQVVFGDTLEYTPASVATRTQRHVDKSGQQVEVEGVVDCTNFMGEHPVCNFTRNGAPFTCAGDYQEVRRKSWGVESGHLMVWMRIAGLPTFRKLLGKIDQKLEKGTYRVLFENNFPSAKFGGRKMFVLSTGSMWGGHSDNLGWCCVFVGCCCLMFGTWKLVQCIHCPRPLGDVQLLSR